MANVTRSRFQRNRLDARAFYEREFAGQLRRISRAGWCSVRCAFHRPDKHPSLRINTITGAFKCWACGASGDLVRFVMQTRGCDFRSAAQLLGAWDESKSPRRRSRRQKPRHERPPEVVEPRAEHLAIRDRLHSLEREYRETSTRLCELREGVEAEECWRRLSELHEAIRSSERDYYRAAGLENRNE